MIKKLLKTITHTNSDNQRVEKYRDLIRREAKIGGKLFGPVAADGRREFFCLDEHTWVWHEEWTDKSGQKHIRTVRYDVRPSGVLKSVDGHYSAVSPEETKKLYEAAKLYRQRVAGELYHAA